jgi:hypothetical protein
MTESKRALITGITGQDGSYLVRIDPRFTVVDSDVELLASGVPQRQAG